MWIHVPVVLKQARGRPRDSRTRDRPANVRALASYGASYVVRTAPAGWPAFGTSGIRRSQLGIQARRPWSRRFRRLFREAPLFGDFEPVAEEGQIFASDAFAALAAITKASDFLCDYAGTRKLPKGAGILSTFLVRPARWPA